MKGAVLGQRGIWKMSGAQWKLSSAAAVKGNIHSYPPIKLIGSRVALPWEQGSVAKAKPASSLLFACDFRTAQHFFPLERQRFRTNNLPQSHAAFTSHHSDRLTGLLLFCYIIVA